MGPPATAHPTRRSWSPGSGSACGRYAAGAGLSPALLEMVLLGGRDRTVAELRELASEAGLVVWAAGWQPSGRFAVECRPA